MSPCLNHLYTCGLGKRKDVMVIIAASLNSFPPSLLEIGGVDCNASNYVNMALMEKEGPG